jgi:hypothetical protein
LVPNVGRLHLRTRNVVLAGVAIAAVLFAVFLSHLTRLTPQVRERIVAALSDKFDSEVELADFQVSIFPRPEVWGSGLVIRHEGRRDVPPLITIRSFSAAASVVGLVGSPLHLRSVTLEGLDIYVPPDRNDDDPDVDSGMPDSPRGRLAPPAAHPAHQTPAPGESPLVIDNIMAMNARLQIASKKPGKLPRSFEIHELSMDDFAFDHPATFTASLTNPKPKGQIAVEGHFGPWLKKDPRGTALGGNYVFENADLDTIKGIGGILSSAGQFEGELERVRISGNTETPDFQIDHAGHAVDLKTSFEAVVDGTSGDTWLMPVNARFLDTEVIANGAVVRAEEVKGRIIALDVAIPKGRIEDLLKLAIKSPTPPLVGEIRVVAKMKLPPGEQDVPERLDLAGRFDLVQATFTNYNIQKRINTLSTRGRGDEDTSGKSVVSGLGGHFTLRRGVLTLPDLTFRVPGAMVQLSGSYGIESEMMDFRGHLLLDSSLAETTSGYKAVLATIAQPFFRRKGGGSKLPIRVSGHRKNPTFGLDMKRALLPG